MEKDSKEVLSVELDEICSFFLFRPSSLPNSWILKLLDEFFDSEKLNQHVEPNLILRVREKLNESVKEKRERKLCGRCLAKIDRFCSIRTTIEDCRDFPSDDDFIGLIEQLVEFYSTDDDEMLAETSRLVLRTIFEDPAGREIFENFRENRVLSIFSNFFRPTIVLETNKLSDDEFSSDSDPWRLEENLSFPRWLSRLNEFLFQQIELFYREKNVKGHPLANVFLLLKPLTRIKIDLAKRIFPHLVHSLLFLPNDFQFRTKFTEKFHFLLEQILENPTEVSASIGQLVVRTINFLRRSNAETINKRNVGKTTSAKLEHQFCPEMNFFLLSKCAAKFQFFHSAILYADLWATKQRFDTFSPLEI